MKILFFFIVTLSLLIGEEGLKALIPSNQNFMIKTESYKIYDSKGKVLRLYQKTQNGEMKLLWSFTLDDTTGACHERSIEEGSYEINGSEIIFYTLWNRYGTAEAPYGARIKKYTIDTNGELKLLSSKIYIETERKSEAKNSAMQYLFTPPTSKEEKEALQRYVENAEKRFNGTFVFGKEAQSLIKEVNSALDRKRRNTWH